MAMVYGHNDANHLNAVTDIDLNGTNRSFSYDLNGNMTGGYDLTDPAAVVSHGITYTVDNMPDSVTRGAATTNFIYDGDGITYPGTYQISYAYCPGANLLHTVTGSDSQAFASTFFASSKESTIFDFRLPLKILTVTLYLRLLGVNLVPHFLHSLVPILAPDLHSGQCRLIVMRYPFLVWVS